MLWGIPWGVSSAFLGTGSKALNTWKLLRVLGACHTQAAAVQAKAVALSLSLSLNLLTKLAAQPDKF